MVCIVKKLYSDGLYGIRLNIEEHVIIVYPALFCSPARHTTVHTYTYSCYILAQDTSTDL